MTALTAAARRKKRSVGNSIIRQYPVGTAITVWQGAIVGYNKSTGRAIAATKVASRECLGIALETKTGVTAATVFVDVESNLEVLIDAAAALTAAYVGNNAFVSDDNQVTTASNAGSAPLQVEVGRLTQLEDGDAWVFIGNFSRSDV